MVAEVGAISSFRRPMVPRNYPLIRSVVPSDVIPGHPDFDVLSEIHTDILARIPDIVREFPLLVQEAFDFVLDPVRTGRNRLSQLDNVEKTFIGLKVEHFIRDRLEAPKGIRDLVLAGYNVDVKNTVGASWAWMIPPETYGLEEPCLLAAFDEVRREAWLGLFVARQSYLGRENRDRKRGILTGSYRNIMWLVRAAPLAPDPWEGLDMARFREIRKIPGGTDRAIVFFRENLRRPTRRRVLQTLLFPQVDYMKRLRSNGGARDILRDEGIALLSGGYGRGVLERLGFPRIGSDEFIAVAPQNEYERVILREEGLLT